MTLGCVWFSSETKCWIDLRTYANQISCVAPTQSETGYLYLCTYNFYVKGSGIIFPSTSEKCKKHSSGFRFDGINQKNLTLVGSLRECGFENDGRRLHWACDEPHTCSGWKSQRHWTEMWNFCWNKTQNEEKRNATNTQVCEECSFVWTLRCIH